MAYANGRLPANVLAPIPGGQLRKDAAAAWNAMCAEARQRYGVQLLPLGPASSYRTLPQQEYLWDHVSHPHDTNWVAEPGTSNHGWGLAVDLKNKQMRWIIDQIGEKYGWAKKWSDAPGEWWHIKWREGVWHPSPAPKPNPQRFLTAHERDLVNRLAYHRRGMAQEAKTGKGAKYVEHLHWARWYKAQIRGQMARIITAVRADHMNWKPYHRGIRYQILRRAYGG